MTTYVTKERDVLDSICFEHYGYAPKAMEAVLKVNPWLAEYTGFLPAGLTIVLPDLEKTPPKDVIRIWNRQNDTNF